jgi:hypothetical protein
LRDLRCCARRRRGSISVAATTVAGNVGSERAYCDRDAADTALAIRPYASAEATPERAAHGRLGLERLDRNDRQCRFAIAYLSSSFAPTSSSCPIYITIACGRAYGRALVRAYALALGNSQRVRPAQWAADTAAVERVPERTRRNQHARHEGQQRGEQQHLHGRGRNGRHDLAAR